jgi:hypothetical protein
MDITCYIWIIIFRDEDFKYGDVAKFWDYAGINVDPLYVQVV